MAEVGLTEAIIALAGTVSGGLGVKYVEKYFERGSKKIEAEVTIDSAQMSDLAEFRRELMSEINNLREKMDVMQKDHSAEMRELSLVLDEWRLKYFDILKKYNELEVKYQGVVLELENVKHSLISGQPVEVILSRLGDVEDEMTHPQAPED